jgi:hypothetical protein
MQSPIPKTVDRTARTLASCLSTRGCLAEAAKAAASPGFASLRRLAKAGLRNQLFWRRIEVLKDLAEEKERRRPQAHEDGMPLGPALRVFVENPPPI